MYIALVLAQTLVLPIVCGTVELLVVGGDPLLVYGRWWLFWGVGTRLLTAGVSQVVRPGFTIQGILGTPNPGANQIAQELGFANAAFGAAGMAAAFVPEWGPGAAIAGGLYLGLAGVRHLPKRHPNANEIVATWTDLLVFVAMVVYVVASIAHR